MQNVKSIILASTIMIAGFAGLLMAMQSMQVQASTLTSNQADDALLALYILAFDNNPDEPMSLSAYYTPTIQSIVDGTSAAPTKTAVILADLDGGSDTHILIAQAGVLTALAELPEVLHPYLPQEDFVIQELDMSDGQVLGTFLQWGIAQYPNRPTILSFLGHGESIVPKVNFMPSVEAVVPDTSDQTPTDDLADPGADREPEEPIAPLPARLRVHQGFTDYHSASLLSIYDLSVALAMATNDGANPFKTVDLVQCFSSSIEELYELHPYGETILGAPNYMYSKPSMVGSALAAVDSSMTAVEMASTILATYDDELPVEGHPRLMIGVESSKIPAIKDAWDKTSFHLAEALVQELDDTKIRIQTAYTQSAKYDTTLCSQVDFALAPPDAMSDMSDFATQLSSAFGQTSPVGSWALTTTTQIDAAIVARHSRGGVPWFAESEETNTAETPSWSLHGPGISLFTDFSADSPEGLSWQAYWYSDTVSANVPQPFQFLQNSDNGVGWADVFTTYWDYPQIGSGQPLTTTSDPRLAECKPAFLAGRGSGELSANRLVVTMPDGEVSAASTLILGDSLAFSMTVELHSQDEAANPQVLFNIYRNDRRIMSEVETPGYVDADSVSQVSLGRNWQALYPGLYEFEVIVDADGRFVESNEEDNVIRLTIEVVEPKFIHLPFIVR